MTTLDLIKTLLSLLILLAVLNIAPAVKKAYHAFRPRGHNPKKKKKRLPKELTDRKTSVKFKEEELLETDYEEEEDFDYDD